MPALFGTRRAALFKGVGASILQRVVTTNNRVGTQKFTPATANTMLQFRTPHRLGGAVTEFTPWFWNWFSSAANNTTAPYEQYGANSLTVTLVYLEYNGAVVPVKVGGNVSFTVAGNVAYVEADKVRASDFGPYTSLPADAIVWCRAEATISANSDVFGGAEARFTGAAMYAFPPANRINQIGNTGALSAPTGNVQYSSAPAPIMVGKFTTTGVRAVVAVGDSIDDGQAQNILQPFNPDGHGFLSGATEAWSGSASLGTGAIALLHLTRPGDAANGWVANNTFRSQFLRLGNILWEGYGRNNIPGTTAPNPALSVMRANSQSIWAQARAAGVQKIIRRLLLPYNTLFQPTAIAVSGNDITLTVASSSTFSIGQALYVTGVSAADMNGDFTVTAKPSGTQITYTLATTPSTGSPTVNSSTRVQGQYSVADGNDATFNQYMQDDFTAGLVDAVADLSSYVYRSASFPRYWSPLLGAEGTHPSSGATGGSGVLIPPTRALLLAQSVTN